MSSFLLPSHMVRNLIAKLTTQESIVNRLLSSRSRSSLSQSKSTIIDKKLSEMDELVSQIDKDDYRMEHRLWLNKITRLWERFSEGDCSTSNSQNEALTTIDSGICTTTFAKTPDIELDLANDRQLERLRLIITELLDLYPRPYDLLKSKLEQMERLTSAFKDISLEGQWNSEIAQLWKHYATAFEDCDEVDEDDDNNITRNVSAKEEIDENVPESESIEISDFSRSSHSNSLSDKEGLSSHSFLEMGEVEEWKETIRKVMKREIGLLPNVPPNDLTQHPIRLPEINQLASLIRNAHSFLECHDPLTKDRTLQLEIVRLALEKLPEEKQEQYKKLYPEDETPIPMRSFYSFLMNWQSIRLIFEFSRMVN